MKKAMLIAVKTLREYVREPQVFLLLLATPLVLIALYYYSFGGTPSGGFAGFLKLACVDRDEGADSAGGAGVDAGEELIDAVRAAEWDGKPVFSVLTFDDERDALSAVREGRASLSLVVPPEFSRRRAEGAGKAGVSVTGDPSSDTYAVAVGFLKSAVFRTASSGWDDGSAMPDIEYAFTPGTGTKADFDAYVPGLIIFGILFIIITTATTLSRERTMGTFRRFEVSGTGSAGILVGTGLAQLAVAFVQVPLCFAFARLFGFGTEVRLDILDFALACFIGVLAAWSVLGAGYLTAAFAGNETEANVLGTLVLIPFAFLSGALFPLPSPVLFTFQDNAFAVTDLLSVSLAEKALRKILVGGKGLESCGFEIVCIVLLSFVYLVPGILAFRRWGMRNARPGKRVVPQANWKKGSEEAGNE